MTTTAQLPREAILYSLTPAQPSGHVAAVVAVVGLSAPNAHAPLLTLRSAVPAPGAHALARLGAAHVVHADAARALLHIHALPGSSGSSGALAARCIPAAPLRALAASHAASAALAASSAADGHVWLWDPRGRLCASWQAAYRPVTCLAWTDDDDFLISAGDDSRIAAWSVAALHNPASATPAPYALFTDHSLPVTALALSPGSGLRARLYSTSRDGTLKSWSMRTRRLLHTHILPAPLSHLALDASARFAFVAGDVPAAERGEGKQQGGRVWRIDLLTPHGYTEGAVAGEALVTPAPVTSLALSLSATHLLVGLASGMLQIYDVHTSQLLRTVDLAPETTTKAPVRAVSNLMPLLFTPPPPAGSGAGAAQNDAPPITALGRTIEKADEAVMEMQSFEQGDALQSYLTAPSLASSTYAEPAAAPAASVADAEAVARAAKQAAAAQEEIATLRAQLERATKMNEELWAATVAGQAPAGAAAETGAAKKRRAAQ